MTTTNRGLQVPALRNSGGIEALTSKFESGKRTSFAISASIESAHPDLWMWGTFSYWIAGQPVGECDLVTSLRDVLFQMAPIVKDCSQRVASSLLAELSKDDLYSRVFETIYGERDTGLRDIAVEETWDRFQISIPVESFDGWRVYQFDTPEFSRVLWKKGVENARGEVHEFKLPIGTTDTVFK